MGVSFHAAGLAYEDSYDCGCVTYGGYRMALANAIDSEFGALYRAWYTNVGIEEKDDSLSFRSFMFADTEEEIEAIKSLPPVNVQYADKNFLALGKPKDEPLTGNAAKKYAVSVTVDWDAFCKYTTERISEAAQMLLFASDCEGKWSWKECRDMYKELSGYKVDTLGHNYGETIPGGRMRTFNMHEQFMGMMRHCWKRRVNLWWS